jgi:polyphosphate kinase
MGRFLEHSRIYRFGDPAGERQVRYTIGSGDLMERNLDRRIEVLVPVLDPELRGRLEETLELNLADDTMAWELGPDGDWVRVVPVLGISVQRRLQELALERARRRRSPESLS